MSKLAIKGDNNNGKEVIDILTSLGGINKFGYSGKKIVYNNKIDETFYYIDNNNSITFKNYSDNFKRLLIDNDIIALSFTVKEFYEKYPFKIGDNVYINGNEGIINEMYWNDDSEDILYKVGNIFTKVNNISFNNDIKMVDINNNVINDNNIKNIDINTEEGTIGQIIINDNNINIIPKDNYEIIQNNDNNNFVIKKKKIIFPNNFKDCAKIIGFENRKIEFIDCYKGESIITFTKLMVCRDAYYKLLNWEPDWTSQEYKYCIICSKNNIESITHYFNHSLLAFPNEEIKNLFLENFKDDIEICKYLI